MTGGFGRARPGARGAGEGRGRAAEVAQPPPLVRPSLKKGRGSRHFSSLKIKLSVPISLPSLLPSGPSSLPAFKGGPWSAQASRCDGGGGFALPPRRGGAARGPCPGGWPLGVGGQRLHAPAGARHRPTQRHVGGHPSPSAAGAGLRARPSPPVRPRRWLRAAAPRAELAACVLLASPELGSHWRELRASPPPTHLRSGALLSSSPFLKGQCRRPAPPGPGAGGAGGPRRPLPPTSARMRLTQAGTCWPQRRELRASL